MLDFEAPEGYKPHTGLLNLNRIWSDKCLLLEEKVPGLEKEWMSSIHLKYELRETICDVHCLS